jgi:hypothetical protein
MTYSTTPIPVEPKIPLVLIFGPHLMFFSSKKNKKALIFE